MKSRCGYVVAEPALDDLDEIQAFLQEVSGESAASRVMDDFRRAFALLTDHPYLGHVRLREAPESLRFWALHRFLIVYVPDASPLLIVRVIHGSRDLQAMFDDMGLEDFEG